MNEEYRRPYPSYAMTESFGRVRILDYLGNGTFRVLTNKDETRRMPRWQLTFVKDKKNARTDD